MIVCFTASVLCLMTYKTIHSSSPLRNFLAQHTYRNVSSIHSDTSSSLREGTLPIIKKSNVIIDSHEGMNGTEHTINKNEIERQFFNFSSDLGDCNHISIPSDLFIPIFVLSRDRVGALKKSVESYQQTFASLYEIIILDHNSTYPPMIEYLKRMQDEKQFTVHFLQSEKWDDALSESSRFIEQYLKDHPHAGYYVFTDSDIAFYHTQSDVLLFYAANLASCPKIEVVGPALKISDIPNHYTFGEAQWLIGHQGFWSSPPNLATWKGIGYHVVKNPIDTTFAMRRRKTTFNRMINGGNTLRCYAPYVATHTDWYLNSSSLPEDKVWYKDNLGVNKEVNHH
eukprot:CAMPEP_0194366618 /NCGR_PEP_ID=MMETSP0174-20130528/14665_1 /TAXON_ID=216777 /ORGANISM="Proboscia alata, Strain PI-D3" /LENGTH=339 /DNA_ID=CAMNT_0039141907 /DNA_START=243 /DNA_END=1262 /DNA_ORIENTATION=-